MDGMGKPLKDVQSNLQPPFRFSAFPCRFVFCRQQNAFKQLSIGNLQGKEAHFGKAMRGETAWDENDGCEELTLFPHKKWKWKMTLNERKLTLKGAISFPLNHDYGRKGTKVMTGKHPIFWGQRVL